MVSNTIRLSFVNLLLIAMLSCTTKPIKIKNVTVTKKVIDTCGYYAYDAHQIVSNLSCYNCHVKLEKRLDSNIATFSELSAMDSLKLIDYAFTKRHKGDYGKKGAFKTSRMDSLSECEIKNAIQYIKNSNRNIPIPSQ
jgi:hypothetical protein